MKAQKLFWVSLALISGLALALSIIQVSRAGSPQAQSPQAPIGTIFSYQGRLSDSDKPANGLYDFEFSLYDTLTNTVQVAGPVTLLNIPVNNGLFNLYLDFGDVFHGSLLFLETRVRPGGSLGAFTTLVPRQPLTAVPYASYAMRTGGGGGGGWLLSGNSGTNPAVNFLGTIDPVTLTLKVNGMSVMRLVPRPTSPNIIGGFELNRVAIGMDGDVIGGGGSASSPNSVAGNFSTVGGGSNNRIENSFATICGGGTITVTGSYGSVLGGRENTVSGDYASVGGGWGNLASGESAVVGGGGGFSYSPVPNKAIGDWSTTSGGRSNTASGPAATVGGGDGNTASGLTATIPGGSGNTASGAYSFAAGAVASATDGGSFVWSSYDPTASWGDNTFTVRAHGGVRFYSAAGTGTGVQLSSGGNSWGSISDRNAKENFITVDSQWLLQQLAAMPVQTWNLKSQPAEMRHIGPFAQDFNGLLGSLFGKVEDPLRINNMDAIGVSLAAIQGLYQQNLALKDENAGLKNQLVDLNKRVSALESGKVSPNAASSLIRDVFPWAVCLCLGLAWFLRRKGGQGEHTSGL